jgi:hypothetical protein
LFVDSAAIIVLGDYGARATTRSAPPPTSGTTTPTTPVAPTLTVPDHSLSVSPGGQVSLGTGVSVPHAGDNVSVKISGLPGYETITADDKTFRGSSVTLTAAEAKDASLSSSYRGHGHPTAFRPRVSALRFLSRLPSTPEMLIGRRKSYTPLQKNILPIKWTRPACKTRNGLRID